ncbi:hypothetical protein HY504_01440 [Candidatus Wolfebacteria bacterium]|nr:hypothetical protein [Candidatus Wolfebacteria bacterium]
MTIENCYKKFLTIALIAVGVVFAPIVFVSAQTNITPDEQAAFAELAGVTGQAVVTVAQARELCNVEKFLTHCAEIGKKHNLYKPEEIRDVDAILAEFKGKVADDLRACASEECLIEVANKIASQVARKNPTLARKIDLTPAKVGEKKVIASAAKDAGVSFAECQAMDPDTASIDILRACAKLAKDARIQKYIPEERRKLADQTDATANLREALTVGQYQCGDNTIEGCGNFCLNPSAGARAQGTAAIPPVCRMIAASFFGPEGVKELESAYAKVQSATVLYEKKAAAATFTTHDGRVLFNPRDVGRYLEEEGKRGNIEAVERGMNFLVAQGFIKPADKEFALKMVQKAKERGGITDFDQCARNVSGCEDFIPEEDRAQFDVMGKIYALMTAEMNKEGVPSPEVCDQNPKYGEACLRVAKRVLPQIEALAANVPEAQFIVREIRGHIEDGESGFEARGRAQLEFDRGGGILTIGEKQFRNFEEMEAYCRTNGNECLAEAAKKGFIEKDYAAKKFERVYEDQYQYDVNRGYPGPYPGFEPPRGLGTPPGQIPGFTSPGPGFGVPPGFNKEEVRRAFEKWLENPVGPPPMPGYPYGGLPDERGSYVGDYPYPPIVCQQYIAPCPVGYYRQILGGPPTCPNYGQCVPAQTTPQTTSTNQGIVCPALPTVDSCPSGQVKTVSFSSPECGTYYTCRSETETQPPQTTDRCSGYGSGWHSMYNDGNCFDPLMQNYRTSDGTRYSCSFRPINGCQGSSTTGGGGSTMYEAASFEACMVRQGFGGDVSRIREWTRRQASIPWNELSSGAQQAVSQCEREYYNSSSGTGPGYGTPPQGQREQVWNSQGLRSYIRADADQARIDSLKTACANVQSSANVWMPDAGNSASTNFGMPSADKCSAAAACSSGQYFDGASCVSSTGTGGYYGAGGCRSYASDSSCRAATSCVWYDNHYDGSHCDDQAHGQSIGAGTGGYYSSCTRELNTLLGPGCHQMYNDAAGAIYCDGPMTQSAHLGDTAVTQGCRAPASTQSTTIPASSQREVVWNSLGLRSWVRIDADPDRIESLKRSCGNVPGSAAVWMPRASDAYSLDFGMPDPSRCATYVSTASTSTSQTTTSTGTTTGTTSGTGTTYTAPAGQREQIWNSFGLRSWVRADASQTRIDSLKSSCANVSSNANVWMPNAGISSSADFGMPDADKCNRAAACTSGQYFDGASCVSGTSGYASGGGGTSSLQSCFYSNASRNGQSLGYSVWCERDYYNCHERTSAGASVSLTGLSLGSPSSCESGWTSGSGSSSSCPSGQYWYVPPAGGAGYCTSGGGGGSCDWSTQYWKSATNSCAPKSNCTDSSHPDYSSSECQGVRNTTGTYSGSGTTSGTSACSDTLLGLLGSGCHNMGSAYFNSAMDQYVLPGTTTVKSCSTDYTSGCTSGSGGGGSSCPSGQYWSGSSCVNSTTQSDPASSCTSSGGTWNGTNCSYGGTTSGSGSCSSGQYWNGNACVTSSSGGTTYSSDPATACGQAGGTWDGSTCQMPSATGGTSSLWVDHSYAEILTSLGAIAELLRQLSQ